MTSSLTSVALDQAQVEALESRRWNALRSGDLQTLGDLFADDLTYVHSNGVEDSKVGYLAALGSGALQYRMINYSTTAVRLHGPTAVVTGSAEMAVETPAGDVSVAIAYSAVWCSVNTGPDGSATPRLIAWHSSPRSN